MLSLQQKTSPTEQSTRANAVEQFMGIECTAETKWDDVLLLCTCRCLWVCLSVFALSAIGNAFKIQVYRVRERAINQECGEIFAVLLLHWYSPTIILVHCPSVCENSQLCPYHITCTLFLRQGCEVPSHWFDEQIAGEHWETQVVLIIF